MSKNRTNQNPYIITKLEHFVQFSDKQLNSFGNIQTPDCLVFRHLRTVNHYQLLVSFLSLQDLPCWVATFKNMLSFAAPIFSPGSELNRGDG